MAERFTYHPDESRYFEQEARCEDCDWRATTTLDHINEGELAAVAQGARHMKDTGHSIYYEATEKIVWIRRGWYEEADLLGLIAALVPMAEGIDQSLEPERYRIPNEEALRKAREVLNAKRR